jgi:tRNA threonylcarbamoyladenosine biosynthesis protein TsaB
LIHERRWYAPRRHSAELLPAIEELLKVNNVSKADLGLLIATIGPGGYTGLRVGVSVAKTLAYGLGIGAVGVNRLYADAAGWLNGRRSVCAVHRAGRKDLAIAIYEGTMEEPVEVLAPRLIPNGELLQILPSTALVSGEIDGEQATALREAGHEAWGGIAGQRRPLVVAGLGLRAAANGASTEPHALLPVYLRSPVQEPASEA